MADKRISELASVSSVVAANQFAVNESGVSKKATAEQIAVYAAEYAGLPKGYMTGLRCRYSSATAIVVEAGQARDGADAADITLAAEVTVSITTIDAIQGLDEKTATATATTHGTATFEPSASLYAETALSSTVRSLTGTVSTVGTAATGTSTKFLTEIAVGDVIRSATKGASRVAAIASDTALTLVAALPGGDATGEAFTLYENLIVRIASETPQRVNTISHAGTSVVVPSAWTSSTSGVTIKIGGEIASCWYFPWLVSGGSGTGVILSTQRTTPFGVTGYTTSKRRIPCAVYNDVSGNLDNFEDTFGGSVRQIMWIDDGVHALVSGSQATTETKVETTNGCPPTAKTIVLRVAIFDLQYATTAGYLVAQLRSNRAGTSLFNGAVGIQCGTTAATRGTNYSSGFPIAVESAGGLHFLFAQGGTGALSGGGLYINAMGWWEVAP